MSKDAGDKRIVFMAVTFAVTFVFFFAALASWSDRSWQPLIDTAVITGGVIGTVTFFTIVMLGAWRIAKRLFPGED